MRTSHGRRLLPVAACLALLLPRSGYGQTWHNDSLYSQFAWGSVFVVVHADTLKGVRISAATSANRYSGTRHTYSEHFNPDSVLEWVNAAHNVARYHGPPPDGNDSAAAIQTRPLLADDSAEVIVSRRRTGSGWSDSVSVIFLAGTEKDVWSIEARPDEADALFGALLTQASRSALAPPEPSPPIEQPDPSAPYSWPSLLVATVRPRMPDAVRSRDGEVVMQFVIGTDGRAEPASLEPVVYSDPLLVQPAFDVILGLRFRPGALDGEAVRVRVEQRVRFGRR